MSSSRWSKPTPQYRRNRKPSSRDTAAGRSDRSGNKKPGCCRVSCHSNGARDRQPVTANGTRTVTVLLPPLTCVALTLILPPWDLSRDAINLEVYLRVTVRLAVAR